MLAIIYRPYMPMNPLMLLWVEIIKRPIYNILLLLLALFGGNLGWAIIVLTLIFRLLLVKSALAGMKMQGQMTDLQPKMQEIQEKHKDEPDKMSQEMMNLLKKSGGGPLKGCLTMLAQIPVFLGLFYNVRDFAQQSISVETYSFMSGFSVQFEQLQTVFYGIDLLEPNNIVLTVLACIVMYTQMQFATKLRPQQPPKIPGMGGENMPDMSKMMGFMNVFFVAMMGAFVWSMPSGVGLYVLTTTFFGILQYAYQYRTLLSAKFRAFIS